MKLPLFLLGAFLFVFSSCTKDVPKNSLSVGQLKYLNHVESLNKLKRKYNNVPADLFAEADVIMDDYLDVIAKEEPGSEDDDKLECPECTSVSTERDDSVSSTRCCIFNLPHFFTRDPYHKYGGQKVQVLNEDEEIIGDVDFNEKSKYIDNWNGFPFVWIVEPKSNEVITIRLTESSNGKPIIYNGKFRVK